MSTEMITKDELAAMIVVLESQPHLSIKEEKYLKVCKELLVYRETEEEVDAFLNQYQYGEWL